VTAAWFYIGAERVDDVTIHPAFREGAKTVAGLYGLKADPSKRELFSYDEDGESISLYWLRCRNPRRSHATNALLQSIADATYGFVGRSPIRCPVL
jgi:4-hydroxyphenylacetate 3-monooxygenase